MNDLVIRGTKPQPRKLNEVQIVCYNCEHRWDTEADYNLLSWGWINCPECGTTNEIS